MRLPILPVLSAPGIAVLLATIGLSSAGLSSEHSVAAKQHAQTIRITDSLIEVTRGEPASSVLIINSRGPRPFHQQIHQQIHQQSSLQAARLNQPYTLTVETTGRALNATIKVDGQTIKTLTNQSEAVDLSPYLSSGQHTIEISGTYSPTSASVQVLLTGPGTQISQQVSGGGTLSQTLQISVQ